VDAGRTPQGASRVLFSNSQTGHFSRPEWAKQAYASVSAGRKVNYPDSLDSNDIDCEMQKAQLLACFVNYPRASKHRETTMAEGTWYNGYNPRERNDKLKAMKRALSRGELLPAQGPCALCNDPEVPVEYHDEDYGEPFLWHGPSHACPMSKLPPRQAT
jgi:hypothetical protein